MLFAIIKRGIIGWPIFNHTINITTLITFVALLLLHCSLSLSTLIRYVALFCMPALLMI